jgi:retron-type reverse transcriptase
MLKLLERTVTQQLAHNLESSRLLPVLQSGFRSSHSTETAVLRVLSDLPEAVDNGDYAALVLLDLSAAFDIVDHAILLKRLQTSFGINSPVIFIFIIYLFINR